MHKVLLIEDNPGDARLIREMTAEEPGAPFEVECAERLAQGLERLSAGGIGLVLLDLSLPDSMGLETFAKVYAHSPAVPISVLTGNDDNNLALAAVKRGAQDYLVKGRLDRELLLRSMQYAIERKRYQLQLEHQANYDALTGLPNRTLLNDRLRQSVYGQRLRRAVAVVVIDLDHFKFVNNSLGHATGDRLLKAMAERLRGMLRDGDTVARLGGDEFVLILNDQSSEEVIYRAMQRIADELARPLEIDGKELVVTCSAGISLYPQDGPDVETLLKNADAAMYRAKERGRNNFRFFTAEMNERVNERLALESALRRALERRELVLHYQSRVDLATGAISGAEAVLRWLHPACGLMRKVSRVLEETGLHPQSLEMAPTESTVMHDVDAAIATLQGLKSLGVSLSVDDFGTGYPSLAYLEDLPIDKLKIDRSFVRDIGADTGENEGVLAQAIISLGHNLGLHVVAEGVETDAQARFLRRAGCDEVQGFFYGEAVAPAQHATLLARTSTRKRA